MPDQSRMLIKNAYLYLSEICSNPRTATASALAIQEKTVTTVTRKAPEIDSAEPTTETNLQQKTGRKAVVVDQMDKTTIRFVIQSIHPCVLYCYIITFL